MLLPICNIMVVLNRSNLYPTVLIVEDQEQMMTMLSYNLKRHGFSVQTASNGEQAVSMLEATKPSMVVINYEINGNTGIQLCHRIKKSLKNVPIVVIGSSDVIEKLPSNDEFGPDSYIKLPATPSEVIANIKSIFRRNRPLINTRVINYHDIEMNLASYKVKRDGREVHLGPTEFRILQCLLEHPRNVLSRAYIMNYVWGKSDIEPRTIDVHINRLRKALKKHPDELPMIETIRSIGYCMRQVPDNENLKVMQPIEEEPQEA